MQFVIRPFDDATDRAAVVALYQAAWHAAYDSVDGAASIDQLIETLSAGEAPEMFALPEGDIALVADCDGQIIGGARAHPRADGIHLSALYVLPAVQRDGVGAALLEILLARFPRSATWRAAVRPESEAAQNFYKRHGFVETGRDRADVGGGHMVDVIEMARLPGVLQP